jgi:hypothetical protein
MKKYLKALVQKLKKTINYPFNAIKHIHRSIEQVEDVENPYKVFIAWFIDVLQYGFVAEFIRLSLLGSKGFWYSIVMIISFGLMRWFWLDIVKETRQALK